VKAKVVYISTIDKRSR